MTEKEQELIKEYRETIVRGTEVIIKYSKTVMWYHIMLGTLFIAIGLVLASMHDTWFAAMQVLFSGIQFTHAVLEYKATQNYESLLRTMLYNWEST